MALKSICAAIIAAGLALAVAGAANAVDGRNDGQGGDSVIDKPPSEAPQYGRSNLPDSTMSGGNGFAFPNGSTTISFPDPCAVSPKPTYCNPPAEDGGGAGNPPPASGTASLGDESMWVGCGWASSGTTSFSASFRSDRVLQVGYSCPSCGRWTETWLPESENPADYSFQVTDRPDSTWPGNAFGSWVNLANGGSVMWEASSTNGLPVNNRVGGRIMLRKDSTGAVISRDLDVFLVVRGECL